MCDIDLLCSKLKNTSLSYIENKNTSIDEYKELQDTYNSTHFDLDLLNKSIDRYTRYINEITIWAVETDKGDIYCVHIKELILLFLNESMKEKTLQNLTNLFHLIKTIDFEIMKFLKY